MNFYYIDESGTSLKDPRNHYFVLCSISLFVRDWHKVDKRITTMKEELLPWAKPEDYEIKGKDLRRGDNVFRAFSWADRMKTMDQIAKVISEMPCKIISVVIDKRYLPAFIETDDQMYRISFFKLLDEIERDLNKVGRQGLLLIDARSDLHRSVQDRRLVDAYRDWANKRSHPTCFVELPWFGFSAFYAGLQIADFAAYLIAFVLNENEEEKEHSQIREIYSKIKSKITILTIP